MKTFKELLSELSTSTMKSYLNKSFRKGDRDPKKRGLAARKVDDKERRGVSEEKLDELSKGTLKSYVARAANDAANHGYRSGHEQGVTGRITKKAGDAIKKRVGRQMGINQALNKLVK